MTAWDCSPAEISYWDQLSPLPCLATYHKSASLIQTYKINSLSIWVAAALGASTGEGTTHLTPALLGCVCVSVLSPPACHPNQVIIWMQSEAKELAWFSLGLPANLPLASSTPPATWPSQGRPIQLFLRHAVSSPGPSKIATKNLASFHSSESDMFNSSICLL